MQPLLPGTRVAVDPAQPCGRCEMCEQGHPNLCHRLHFCGLYPDPGSLCAVHDHAGPHLLPGAGRASTTPARPCWNRWAWPSMPSTWPSIRVADSVAILGAGPIGHFILQLAKLSGADPIYVSDKFAWRLEVAEQYGASPSTATQSTPVDFVRKATGGRGVDVAIEAAWADHSVQQAGRDGAVGWAAGAGRHPRTGRLEMKHSTARRKGLTIRMSRRMKHVYPRAIQLADAAAPSTARHRHAPLSAGTSAGGLRHECGLPGRGREGDRRRISIVGLADIKNGAVIDRPIFYVS